MKTFIFDFDGTLTYNSPSVWKSLWLELGFTTEKDSCYTIFYEKYLNKELNYQEWCDLVCESYQNKNMRREIINVVSQKIKLIKGLTHTIKVLKENGYSLHIVSGGIVEIIENVLGDNVQFFDSINANKIIFDDEGKLFKIDGTQYDFAGKAKFVEEYMKRTNTSPEEIVFLGNSDNDEWVYTTGCKTICINPENTDYTNKTIWNESLPNTDCLGKLLPILKLEPFNCI